MLTDIIEALLFASGTGISSQELNATLGGDYSKKEINKAVADLKSQYSEDRGIILIEYNDKYQFQTNPKYGELLADTLQVTKEREISKTLLQVLAIVAYKNPITKQEIEDIRGANADYVMSALLKHNLIEPVGRKDTVGHPILYSVTDEFMKKFGLETLTDLPDYEELINNIKNNYEKYYEKSANLYRDRIISDEENTEQTEDATKTEQKEVDEPQEFIEEDDDEDMPDFLKGEEFIEVD